MDNRLVDAALIFIVTIVLLGVMVYVHEVTHKEIFRMYGCNSTIQFNLLSGYTEAECPTNPPELDLANAITEAVGYQIIIPAVFISVCLFAIVLKMR